MKKIIFFMSVLSFHFITAQSVLESQLFGGTDSDKATCIDISPTGYIYVAGHSKSSDGDFQANLGNYDCFIKKYSDIDDWQMSFGGSDVDYIYAMDKNVVVGASKSNDGDITGNHGNYDYLVVKFDDNGQIVWQKSFGGSDIDKATAVFVDQNDNIWVLGYSKSTDGDITPNTNHGGYDIWLIKLDSNGNLLWQKTYGGSSDDKSTDLHQGNLISGYSKSSNGDLTQNQGNYDYWLFQIDTTGNIIWQKSYGGSGIDKDPHLLYDSFGLMFVAGSSNSNDGDIANPKGNFDIWEFEFNPNTGDMGTQNNLGGTGADFCTGIVSYPQGTHSTIDNASTAYVCGYSNSDDLDFPVNNGNYDAWIIGIDGNNALHIGGNNVDEILSLKWNELIYNTNGNILVPFAGTSKSDDGDFSNQHGNYDAWFLNCELPTDNSGGIGENQTDINTYPNPVSGFLNIKSDQIKKISVFDVNGRQIYNIQTPDMPDDLRVNLSALKSGQYVLKVKTIKGESSRIFTKL